VVRFKCPNTSQKTVAWDDLVRGRIEFALAELDDFVLLRSDGTPIYQLGVVVDDHDMRMTLVLRGDDHINNTPKQLLLFQALGVEPPQYGHVPMILGPDGKRLSKRHGAASVLMFREGGFLPHALINYLVRLGWSHQDQEIFSREEMIEQFNLEHLQKSPAIFNREKLEWLNQHYIKTMSFAELETEIRWHLKRQNVDVSAGPALEDVVNALRERAKTLHEMVEMMHYFYADFDHYEPKAAQKHLTPDVAKPLQALLERFSALEDWRVETIHQQLELVAQDLNIGMGKVGMPLRVAVSGMGNTPAIDVTVYLIGKERVITRLQKALRLFS
jgi:glutamyl-tRNA synthetase